MSKRSSQEAKMGPNEVLERLELREELIFDGLFWDLLGLSSAELESIKSVWTPKHIQSVLFSLTKAQGSGEHPLNQVNLRIEVLLAKRFLYGDQALSSEERVFLKRACTETHFFSGYSPEAKQLIDDMRRKLQVALLFDL